MMQNDILSHGPMDGSNMVLGMNGLASTAHLDNTMKRKRVSESEETRTNLIINHLPSNLSETEFLRLFSTVGPVKNYRIMRDLKTGSSFGYGFVEFTTSEHALKAIAAMSGYHLQNKYLKVNFAQPAETDINRDTNLYVKNLPLNCTTEQLERIFGQFGRIVQKLIFKDKVTKVPNGIAFVRFQTRGEAMAAIEGLNGGIPEGGKEGLIVKVAKDTSVKKKSAFQAGFQAGLRKAFDLQCHPLQPPAPPAPIHQNLPIFNRLNFPMPPPHH